MLNPLEQFELQEFIIIKIGNFMIFLSNIELLGIIGLISIILLIKINQKSKIINKSIIFSEIYISTIINIIKEQIGKENYIGIIATIFSIIAISNIIGMVPYSFTSTSQFILTLSISISILIGVTIMGFKNQGIEFIKILIPAGTPLGLVPLLIILELISYLARGLSLGIRLGANMMAGHTLIKILTSFTWESIGIISSLLPITAITALIGLEIGIAILQAYVFTALTCSYIRDALILSH